ncbi:uncharacterized protein LOC116849190 [Odontomachus brunneus]|uniref:uncharacterized protein LOC116849190 n=1 Tax=Odontomachus brunneus TaxID=486640 RepID=UPI0013F1E6A3|nr:uncharacterized protein LOC116849190 [Odontomachus brunneus]
MVDDIRAILSPLLFVCYVFGTRIIEYPVNKPRTWCSYLYILLIWLTYSLSLVYTLMCYVRINSIVYQFCFWLNLFTAILTIALGIYHDKKFRSCLRKLAIVDDTLEKLGTTTDYQKLYTKALLIVFVWCAFVLCITYTRALWLKGSSHNVKNLFVAFMLEYGTCTNLLDDLVITGTLGYIRLKFDQVNEYLRKMKCGNEYELKPAWEHSTSIPRRVGNANSTGNACATWIMIHLHLDLRKISRELNSIFGLQMTIKMGTYFAFMALGFRELFNVILIINYVEKTFLFVIIIINFLFANTFRLFIINYMCEEVSVKV